MSRERLEMMRPLSSGDVALERHEPHGVSMFTVMQLAELMLCSYRGTVDDEGESLDDAVAVVEGMFTGEFGALDDRASVGFVRNDRLVAATVVTRHTGSPLVAFSMTRPQWAGRGLGRAGLRHACRVLGDAGEQEVRLVVTAANSRAVRLYESEGFVSVPGAEWSHRPS